ncbi:MAG: TIGR03905 family TSCPD domain-containing protein [Muribaculaceae bacterium]|nr:TIGR03905 family TSCPD domain-containing protein [Muribaculaceae bacterium]MDE5929713.1 TIGR03905 family TSCPD domain-containing protein [Muribaculaceae bacterium]
MKHYEYTPCGTCSRRIDIEIDQDGRRLGNVAFTGGCNGNLKGIAALVKGQDIDSVAATLRGIECGNKGTSCPDQLARALEAISKEL